MTDQPLDKLTPTGVGDGPVVVVRDLEEDSRLDEPTPPAGTDGDIDGRLIDLCGPMGNWCNKNAGLIAYDEDHDMWRMWPRMRNPS